MSTIAKRIARARGMHITVPKRASKKPRKHREKPGHALRVWQAREGRETPEQLAALAKYGER